jgi:hypothetical protein
MPLNSLFLHFGGYDQVIGKLEYIIVRFIVSDVKRRLMLSRDMSSAKASPCAQPRAGSH